jgi:L,D-transpeptidase ErfK/SrfK
MLKLIWLFLLLIIPSLAFPATYPLPKNGNDIIGEIYTVNAEPGYNLGSLGLRYGMSLHEMMEANPGIGMNANLGRSRKVVVPAQFILPKYRKGIVVNMAELRMFYFPAGGKYVMTFPVAMGRDQWRTPTVSTSVTYKEKDPVWNVPKSIRAWTLEAGNKLLPESVPPGPKNPLGHYALHLAADGYLIHGNNSPTSIGKFVSSGCIRMKNEDIKTLFSLVTVGTPVHIVHQPYMVGWFNNQLYIKAQKPVALDEEASEMNETSLEGAVTLGEKNKTAEVDWSAAERAAKQQNGIPQPIGQSAMQSASNDETQPPLPIAAFDTAQSDMELTGTETHLSAAAVTNIDGHDSISSNDWGTNQ